MEIARIARHLLAPHWVVRRAFPKRVLGRIEAAIKASENAHYAELRFAVEAGLDLIPLLRGVTPRQRATEVFSQLCVWDTEHNSGVLIYVELVDRCIEIVADRGISAKVKPEEWSAICRRMGAAFRERRFEEGAMQGIEDVTALLTRHFPHSGANSNELPDRPVVL